MKKTVLVTALLLTSLQANAAKELISCSHKQDETTSTLKVSETSLGLYEAEVFQCMGDCRNPRQMYYRKGPIYRTFSGATPAMNFKKDEVGVGHIFGATLYSDSQKFIEFPDSSCVVTPPDDRGLVVGFADLEPGPCGTPAAEYEAEVRTKALGNAKRQCPYPYTDNVYVLQEVQVESFCLLQGQGNLYLRAAGLYECKL